MCEGSAQMRSHRKRQRRRVRFSGFSFSRVPFWAWLALGGAAIAGLLIVFRKQVAEGASAVQEIAIAVASNITDHTSFVTQTWSAINASSAQNYPLQAKLYLIGVAAWECGWGTQDTFQQTNNLFNITAGTCDAQGNNCTKDPEWGDRPVVLGKDKECDANGANCKPIMQRWRQYDALSDSVNDYLSFIKHARYKNAGDLLAAGDLSFVDVLHAGGYFSGNLQKYRDSVSSIASKAQSMLPT